MFFFLFVVFAFVHVCQLHYCSCTTPGNCFPVAHPPPHYITYVYSRSFVTRIISPPGLDLNLFYCVICLIGIQQAVWGEIFTSSERICISFLSIDTPPTRFLSEKVNEKNAWFCHPSLSCPTPIDSTLGHLGLSVHDREPLAAPGPSQFFVHIHLLFWCPSRHT